MLTFLTPYPLQFPFLYTPNPLFSLTTNTPLYSRFAVKIHDSSISENMVRVLTNLGHLPVLPPPPPTQTPIPQNTPEDLQLTPEHPPEEAEAPTTPIALQPLTDSSADDLQHTPVERPQEAPLPPLRDLMDPATNTSILQQQSSKEDKQSEARASSSKDMFELTDSTDETE